MFCLHVFTREKSITSCGTAGIDSCELPQGCWELNLEFLEQQFVLLTAEPSPEKKKIFNLSVT